jgi:hypothetical protein
MYKEQIQAIQQFSAVQNEEGVENTIQMDSQKDDKRIGINSTDLSKKETQSQITNLISPATTPTAVSAVVPVTESIGISNSIRPALSQISDPETNGSQAVEGSTVLSEADLRLEKYRKMYKMFPEHIVRMKMTLDKFSPAEIDAFFQDMSKSSQVAQPTDQSSLNSILPKSLIESLEYDFMKFKRLAQSLPEGVLAMKMENEGLSKPIIKLFLKEFYKEIIKKDTNIDLDSSARNQQEGDLDAMFDKFGMSRISRWFYFFIKVHSYP